jgi:anti-anti-sigma regulatory factor
MRTLVLNGELALRDVPDLARSLAEAIGDGGAAIDVAAVESIDSAVLQVLIAGHRSAAEAGVTLGFADPDQPRLRAALVGHGMVAADGTALTPEHLFWTRPVTGGAVTPSSGEAA